jgi:hypothetical protein
VSKKETRKQTKEKILLLPYQTKNQTRYRDCALKVYETKESKEKAILRLKSHRV